MLEEPTANPIKHLRSACLVESAFFVQSSCWILDSGATYHMCSNAKLLDKNKRIYDKHLFITLPNGRKIQV